MYQRLTVLFFVALFIGATASLADIPRAINYQGVLSNASGDPATGTHEITFTIYDSPTSRAILYQETQTVGMASDGSFEVILGRAGTTGALDEALNGDSRWLGITVGTDDEIVPRTELVSSTYSFKVNTVDGAIGGLIKGGMVIEQNMAKTTQGLTIVSGPATFDTIMACPLASCGTILRATNTAGQEVFDASLDPTDESAVLVFKGPGGDDEATITAEGVDLSSSGLAKIFQRRISLSGNYGLQVLSKNDDQDVVAVLAQTDDGGSELAFSSPARGTKVMSISDKGFAALSGIAGDTSVYLDPNNGIMEFRNVAKGFASTKTVKLDAAGLTVYADDGSNDELINVRHTITGPEIQVNRQNVRGITNSVILNADGMFVMNLAGTDTSMQVTSNGNIISRGQIAVGEGCSWGAAKAGEETWSVVFGYNNTASGDTSTISGGYNNETAGRMSTISGGVGNYIAAIGMYSTIGGGAGNYIDSAHCVIAGGLGDSALGDLTTIGGGGWNVAGGWGSTVGGGTYNIVDAGSGTIAGGIQNHVTGNHGAIAGGSHNTAGDGSVVGGGFGNQATGGRATIPGGELNLASAYTSFAAGYLARAENSGTMVFSATNTSDTSTWVSSNNAGQFVVRAVNGLYFTNSTGQVTAPSNGTNLISTSTGAYLTSDGVWTDAPKVGSLDRAVDGTEILGKLEQLPINQWVSQNNNGVRHIGPAPEDFYAQFGLGNNDGSLSSMDMAGVALVAVQELYQMVKKQQILAEELNLAKDELAAKDQRIDALELRLTAMESAMDMVLSQNKPSRGGNNELASNK